MRTSTLLPLVAALAASFACSSEPEVGRGQLGAACPNDRNCIPGLACVDGFCAVAPDAGPGDGGAPDADPIDTGAPDAGAPDTGIEDGGPPDAGPPDGGGVDGGAPDGGNCDVPPRLGAIQQMIFAPSCATAGCHSQASQAGGLRLDLPLGALNNALRGPTQDQAAPQRTLVVPNDPAQSRLYVVMSTRNPGGAGDPMPPDAPVDACSIQAVREWIINGARDD